MRHPSGLPLTDAPIEGAARRCGGCAWSAVAGGALRCEAAAVADALAPAVSPADVACAWWEHLVDCDTCGACCREAFDSVPVTPADRARLGERVDLVRVHEDGWVDLRRVPAASGCGTQCAALYGDGAPGAPFRCHVYPSRPATCRDLAAGSRGCATARRRVGLSLGHEPRRDRA